MRSSEKVVCKERGKSAFEKVVCRESGKRVFGRKSLLIGMGLLKRLWLLGWARFMNVCAVVIACIGVAVCRVKNVCAVMIACIGVAVFMASGCSDFIGEEQPDGRILLSVNKESFRVLKEKMYEAKSVWSSDMENLDTNDFILSIYTQEGAKVYEGKYGKRPGEIVVVPGAYDIKLYSNNFTKPAFNSPMYGDEQTVVVEKNSSIAVTLMCRQINGAMRISFTDDFKKKFLGEGLTLRDLNGEIFYPYASYDFCYVQPGAVELRYSNDYKDTLLFSRQVAQAQMLSLKLSYAPGNRTASLKLDMDTARNWKNENFNVGLKIPTGALTIEQAQDCIGEENVMVFGFIIGGDATENTIRVGPPFKSRTNIVIAPSMLERVRTNMFVVELPSGEIRDALNLVSNRSLLGKAVVITGNIAENYYGYPGIKSTKAYSILY